MTKQICHISPLSIHSTRWIESFHKKGYKVSLITDFRTWVPQEPRNVPIYILPTLTINTAHRRLIPNYISIIKILKQTKPDLIQLHTLHHYAPAITRSHIPYILHSWGLEVLQLHNSNIFRKILAKYVTTKAQKIIVDAECLKKIWTSTGIPENKIEVIPFGVDTNLFNPNTNGNPIRKKLGIRKNDLTIISTRPFFNHYDIGCLIKAIPVIVEKHKNVKFIIKGKGPLESDIRKLAKKLRVDSYIRFTSPVPYHEMPQYLTAADIYVSTSFIDSTSVSLLEAMACGLPPVTTDIPGNREWIEKEVNGLLYSPKDYRTLAEKITSLIENENLRKQFGERSRRVIEKSATWEKCLSQMEAIYKEML